MQIEFRNVIPGPLSGFIFSTNSFWKTGSVVLHKGSFYDIRANSGKGKTTFLDIIFGKRTDFKGECKIDGRLTRNIPRDEWSMLRTEKVSYLFQGLRLFDRLTGYENIAIKNKLTNYLDQSKVDEFAGLLDIDNQMHKKAAHMSFGQRQRLALIRALAQPFNWLLLDEPFSHLDDQLSEKAAGIIVGECKRRQAGLIVTRLDNREFIPADHHIEL